MLSILLPNVPTRWAQMEDAAMSANDGEQMAWRFLPERFRQSESGGSYRRDGARAAGERRFQKGLTQENDMSSKLCLGNAANRALKEAVHVAWALNGACGLQCRCAGSRACRANATLCNHTARPLPEYQEAQP
ncbi:hypothetical protein DYI26_04925 [Halomonas litopenaei]|nr:hypothetical protein [Halomonas litopenaei]